MSLPQRLTLIDMQNRWGSALDPVVNNPIVQGVQLTNQALVVGANSINHKLGRKPLGYIITGMHGSYSQIYDTPSLMPNLTLVLHASAITSVDVYVY